MSASSDYQPFRAILWMTFSGLLFVGVTALVKYLGTGVPAAEAAFLRYALGLVLLVPMIPEFRRSWQRGAITKPLMWVFVGRGAAHSIGVTLWFFAMARIPIADVTAMSYLTPVCVMFGAAVFLREKLALDRMVAVMVALVGVVIILRPGFREVGAGHLTMLANAFFFSCSYLLAKRASDQVSASVVVVMLSLVTTLGLAPLAWSVWVPPSLFDVLILFVVAGLATLGHYAMTRALAVAPVNVTQPVNFLQLIWSVLLGALVFAEGVDIWVIVGGTIILASISILSWRETAGQRRRLTPAPPSTTSEGPK
ncbi:MAG: DMT family transporter [Paracoccaceae bacterium]